MIVHYKKARKVNPAVNDMLIEVIPAQTGVFEFEILFSSNTVGAEDRLVFVDDTAEDVILRFFERRGAMSLDFTYKAQIDALQGIRIKSGSAIARIIVVTIIFYRLSI